MRIALLLDPPSGRGAIDELSADPDSRIVLIPHADRVGHALAVAMRAYGASGDDVITVRRVGDGVVSASEWSGALERRASTLDDEAAIEVRRQLAFATTDDERVALLNETADHGLRLAVEAMQAALRIRPEDSALMERLRAVHEATADWARAVDVAVAAAEQITDPRARALAFVAAAETSASRAKNVGRAVALYEAAISDDAEVAGAFEAIEKVLLDAGDFAGAERAYVRQLERLAGRGPAEVALLDKLARVREEHLGDRRGAIQSLDRLVTLRPDDVGALGRLARLLEENGEDELSVRVLEVAAQHATARVETFRALARIHTRKGDADRAYCAAGVLVQLGEADPDELRMYRQLAPELGVRPTQALDDTSWRMLLPRDLEGGALALLSTLAPTAIDVRLEQLRANKSLPSLDAKEKQDAERTTVSAVRTAAWVAKLLGMPVPDIYVRSRDVPGGVLVLPTRQPAVALGPSVLSGRSVPELAFLLARELSHARLTGRLLVFYPEIAELRGLVTAAISTAVGRSGKLPPEFEPVRRELAKRLSPTVLEGLGAAVRSIGDRGGQLDLLAWLRAIERAACRVGLVACGDLTIAARVLSVDARVVGGLSAADRLRDLVPFSVSPAYADVRRRLGIAARTSSPPSERGGGA